MNSFATIIRRALLFSQGGWELGWLALLVSLTLLPATLAFAAHPLITEDTGTQVQGNGQLELTLEYGHDEVADAEEDAADLSAVLSYGLRDDLDLMLTLPFSRADTLSDGDMTRVQGLGDIGLDAKWRFYEEGPLSVALKAGGELCDRRRDARARRRKIQPRRQSCRLVRGGAVGWPSPSGLSAEP